MGGFLLHLNHVLHVTGRWEGRVLSGFNGAGQLGAVFFWYGRASWASCLWTRPFRGEAAIEG